MPTDPSETLRRRQAEREELSNREKEDAARRAQHAELNAARNAVAECTLSTSGLSDSQANRLLFYKEFATRLTRLGILLKAHGRLAELAHLEGKETALDHAINLINEAANGMTADDLARLLEDTSRDPD